MKNRWVILAAGILIQTVLGGIYAWSTFTPYLIDNYGMSKGQSGLVFGLTIAAFTCTMIFAGRVFTKKGPRLTACIGAVLFMLGYLIASFSNGSFPILIVSLSLIGGAGIGFGYVCPLSVGVKWFPAKKGLVTGAAVAGFGGGAVLLSSIAEYFLHSGTDVMVFFRYYSLIAGGILFASALFMANPPFVDKPKPKPDVPTIFTIPFGIITLGMFAGTFAGLLIIGNLAPLLMQAGLTEALAVTSISIFAIGNAAGRITWGHISDRIGYRSIPVSLGCFAVCCVPLVMPIPIWILLPIVGVLGFGFGANFVVYASVISHFYGCEKFPKLYPVCFLGYGIAGIIGPGMGGFFADATGSYNTALYISIALLSATALAATAALRLFDHNYAIQDYCPVLAVVVQHEEE